MTDCGQKIIPVIISHVPLVFSGCLLLGPYISIRRVLPAKCETVFCECVKSQQQYLSYFTAGGGFGILLQANTHEPSIHLHCVLLSFASISTCLPAYLRCLCINHIMYLISRIMRLLLVCSAEENSRDCPAKPE